MKSILFTQCLQNDFVKPIPPEAPLPNHLHIGYSEAKRLVQSESRLGNVFLFLDNYYGERTGDHHAIHIRDWHSDKDELQFDHLEYFGTHCIAGTEGAEFVAQLSRHNPQSAGDDVIDSTTLNDFVNTDLQKKIESRGIRSSDPWHAAIIGVWTDVKVQYLAYDLVSRYPRVRIAVCSSLCASRSRIRHRSALEFMQSNLDVRVVDSINELLEFMDIRVALRHHFQELKTASTGIQADTDLSEEQKQIIRYLFRDSSKVTLKKLGGGFSGAKVFAVESVDLNGKTEVPQVLKIDTNPKIGKERSAVESIENLLGPSSPRIREFIHMEQLGGLRYFFANMNNTRTKTLQSLLKIILSGPLRADEKKEKIGKVFSEIGGQLFSRLYQNPQTDRINLFQYYDFRPAYAEGTLIRLENILGLDLSEQPEILIPGTDFPEPLINPRRFYGRISEYLSRPPREADMTWVHGDLNLANLLSDEKDNFWMIDFFHTRTGHLMNDFAKMENDIKFILNPVSDAESFRKAVQTEWILNESGFGVLPVAIRGDDIICFIISELRRLLLSYAVSSPDYTDYRIALLRYSAHTLIFDECSEWQKKLAACSTCMLAHDIYKACPPDIHI